MPELDKTFIRLKSKHYLMNLTEYGHLIIDEFGAVLKKKKKRILVIADNRKDEIPIKSVRDLIISGKVSISSELIKELAESGVDILFTSPTGKPVARVVNAKSGGTAENRYEQYRSLEDIRGIRIAKSIISGKIRNQMSNVRYYSKSRRMNEVISSKLYDIYRIIKEKFEKLSSEDFDDLNSARKRLLAYEGECANYYWNGIKLALDSYNFEGRNQKGDDPVNLSLNIAYNMLMGQIWKFTLKFGLDPFMGYIHVERPGKLSLVFDLMEPFRPMVDRFVIGFLKKLSPAHFSEKAKSKTIALLRNQFFEDFMQSKLEYKGRKMRMETVMFYYLQEFVSFLKGNRDSFTIPYLPW